MLGTGGFVSLVNQSGVIYFYKDTQDIARYKCR